jgi:hypothetical protein
MQRRQIRAFVGALGALACALALGSAPALASGWELSSSFGTAGTGLGQFSGGESPTGVAVNDATGEVYVVGRGRRAGGALQCRRRRGAR